jgi:hypothetical protein
MTSATSGVLEYTRPQLPSVSARTAVAQVTHRQFAEVHVVILSPVATARGGAWLD